MIRADRALRGLLQLARDAERNCGAGRRWISWRPATSRSSSAPGASPGAREQRSSPPAWSGPLLAGAGVDVPLAVSSQTVTYFELGSATSAPPAVIDYDGDEPFALWIPPAG